MKCSIKHIKLSIKKNDIAHGNGFLGSFHDEERGEMR